MEHIVFLDYAVFKGNYIHFSVDNLYDEYESSTSAEAVQRLQDATIAVTNSVKLGESELAQLPKLKLIAVAATGTDNIDLGACQKRRIAVANVRDWCTASVPEHIFSLILALKRRLLSTHEQVQDGTWHRSQRRLLIPEPLPTDLNGSVLGIIGYGTLGRRVESIAQAFGMKVLISEHKGIVEGRTGRVAFDTVLTSSDILALLCPLTTETYHLIGPAELARMKSTALIINAGRGGVVDEVALAQALTEGKVAGAGLDVLEQEPPALDHPLINGHQNNVIITSHVAWASAQSMQNILDQIVANIEAFVQGRPRI